MDKLLEIMINKKLKDVENNNKMLNCNFDMKFKILKKTVSIK